MELVNYLRGIVVAVFGTIFWSFSLNMFINLSIVCILVLNHQSTSFSSGFCLSVLVLHSVNMSLTVCSSHTGVLIFRESCSCFLYSYFVVVKCPCRTEKKEKELTCYGDLFGYHNHGQVFQKRLPPEAVDLVCRFFQYSPNLRCTAVSSASSVLTLIGTMVLFISCNIFFVVYFSWKLVSTPSLMS